MCLDIATSVRVMEGHTSRGRKGCLPRTFHRSILVVAGYGHICVGHGRPHRGRRAGQPPQRPGIDPPAPSCG